MTNLTQIVVRRHKLATAVSLDQLIPTLEALVGMFDDFQELLAKFPKIMLLAKSEAGTLPEGRVWQERFIKFFDAYNHLCEYPLRDNREILDNIYGEYRDFRDFVNSIEGALYFPRPADISFAMSDIDFFESPKTRRDEITYNVDKLKKWYEVSKNWVTSAERDIKGAIPKAQKLLEAINPV